jgi:hypothetical protein
MFGKKTKAIVLPEELKKTIIDGVKKAVEEKKEEIEKVVKLIGIKNSLYDLLSSEDKEQNNEMDTAVTKKMEGAIKILKEKLADLTLFRDWIVQELSK